MVIRGKHMLFSEFRVSIFVLDGEVLKLSSELNQTITVSVNRI